MSGLINYYRDMTRSNAFSSASLPKACCRLSDDRDLRETAARHFDAGA